MTDDELKRLAAATGQPFSADSPYFANAEPTTAGSWRGIIPPFIGNQDLTRCIDLAAGHGRHTEQLLQRGAGEVFILDIQPSNIEVCRQRFVGHQNVRVAVNSGFDFSPVSDNWATFVFCFDAMVHFDSDVVRSYLRDLRRILSPNGQAFFHHSNQMSDVEWSKARHARNFMSQELFAHYARKEGLHVVRQKLLDWGGVRALDCLSLVSRPS